MARILLAEDDDNMRVFLARALRKAGHEVHAVADGDAALAWVSERPIDLLLADVVMPGMRGGQVARQVKDLFPGVQVVQMTGYTDKPDELAATGEDPRVLHKPFDLADLRTLVRETLDRPTARP